jgi:AraC family transcriptional activator of pobA
MNEPAHEIRYYKEISDFVKKCNLPVKLQTPDFLIFNYDEVPGDSWVDLARYRQNYFEISLEITRGCSFMIDQFEFPAQANRVSFVCPHRLYSVKAHTENQPTYKGYTIFFTENFIRSENLQAGFLKDYPFFNRFNPPFISLDIAATTTLEDIFQKMHVEYQRFDALSREIILHYLHVLFLLGKRYYKGAAYKESSLNRSQVIYNEFERLLQLHFLELSTVKQYADKMHISPKHLSETIKEITGENALTLIHKAQINYAKALLLQTSLPVSQIADQLSFETNHYFSAFFKRHTGITPMEFRSSQ